MSDGGAPLAQKALEALDNHNVALAETTIESGLKKFPTHHGLRSARAYCLLKSGFTGEAVALAEALAGEDIRDPTALNAISHVFQSTCCWDSLACMYEKAIAVLGETKQTLENLLQTYVRKGDFAKAQKVAGTLCKKHPSPQYQVWNVMAILGQVPPDAPSDSLFLKLATRMLDTAILTESGVRKPETVKMYVDVLLQQNMVSEAVAFLQSPRGAFIGLPEARMECLAGAFAKLGRHDVVCALGLLRWEGDSDHWEAFLQFADNMPAGAPLEPLPTITLQPATGEPGTPLSLRLVNSLQDALAIAAELSAVEIATRGAKMRRGPFLATLELLKRQGISREKELAAKVVSYCGLFGTKGCCFMDILPYLTRPALEELRKRCEQESDGSLASHQKAILLLNCSLAVGDIARMTDEEAQSIIARCLDKYKLTTQLSAALEWSEEGVCDGYITAAVNIAWRRRCSATDPARRRQWTIAALACLHGRARFLNNPTWLMLSALLSKHLGLAHTAALKQLDCKSIQHDSMPHIGYFPLEAGLALPEISKWCSAANFYYSNLAKDLGLLRSKVFMHVSWPVMRDIARFESRHRYSIARIESVANHAVWQIAECQTSRDLLQHLASSGEKCGSALRLLLDERERLCCNADQTVAQTLVLGPMGSAETKELAGELLASPTAEQRSQRVQAVLGLLVVLHDLASVQLFQQRKTSMPKPKKGSPATADEIPAPVPLWQTFDDRASNVFSSSPVLQHVAEGLLMKESIHCTSTELQNMPIDAVFLQTMLLLSAAVRICPPRQPQLSPWCRALADTCDEKLPALEELLGADEESDWSLAPNGGSEALRIELKKQRAVKVLNVRELLKQLKQDAAVAAKRR